MCILSTSEIHGTQKICRSTHEPEIVWPQKAFPIDNCDDNLIIVCFEEYSMRGCHFLGVILLMSGVWVPLARSAPLQEPSSEDALLAPLLCQLPARALQPATLVSNDERVAQTIGANAPEYISRRAQDINGTPQEQFILGMAYSQQMLWMDDAPSKACRLFQRAAAARGADAYAMLGEVLLSVEQTDERSAYARAAFQRAVINGHILAELRLAEMILGPTASDVTRKEAEKIILKLAQTGFVPAQVSFGLHAMKGSFGVPNYQDARTWLGVAASQREPRASFALGEMLLRGAPGIAPDSIQAMRYLREAGAAGYGSAYALIASIQMRTDAAEALKTYQDAKSIGVNSLDGNMGELIFFGGPKLLADPARGFKLLNAAAAQNDSYALVALGRLYRAGTAATPKDQTVALHYFERAIALGDVEAKMEYALGLRYEKASAADLLKASAYLEQAMAAGIGRAFTIKAALEIEQNGALKSYAKVLGLYAKGYQHGDPEAGLLLAINAIRQGDVMGLTRTDGLRILHALADAYYTRAATELGENYLTGRNIPANPALGYEYIKKAVEQKDEKAKFWQGMVFRYGMAGQQRDAERAFQLMTTSLIKHTANEAIEIARLYAEPFGTVRNMKEARNWYTRAHELGNFNATRELALIIEAGSDGSHPDPAKALTYLKEVASYGDYQAEILLKARQPAKAIPPSAATTQQRNPNIDPEMLDPNFNWRSYAARKETERKAAVAKNIGTTIDWAKQHPLSPSLRTEAAKGDASSQNELGYRLMHGYGMPVNLVEAFGWISRSAVQGNARALTNMAVFLAEGTIIKQDMVAAAAYCLLSLRYDRGMFEPDQRKTVESWCQQLQAKVAPVSSKAVDDAMAAFVRLNAQLR
jgi:uncharacterized protein